MLRSTTRELLDLGVAGAYPKGGLIWWNTDYPNYFMFEAVPDYDYYVSVEYDTCVNVSLDDLIAKVAGRGLDFVSLPTRQDLDSWYWTKPHLGAYARDDIRASLNCIAIYSNRAMRLLLARRRAMTLDLAAGRIGFWPGNEVFSATEISRAGYRTASLDEFGDASGYEWHPPHLEDDLPYLSDRAFLHPVLDQPRFIKSLLKFEFDLSSYFFPSSPLRQKLSRFPAAAYVPHMPGAFRDQAMVKLRQALGSL